MKTIVSGDRKVWVIREQQDTCEMPIITFLIAYTFFLNSYSNLLNLFSILDSKG